MKEPKDYWEAKAGCVIRHHVTPRRKLFDPALARDLPIPVDKLDAVRVTVMVSENKKVRHFTDKIGAHSPRHLGERSWRGVAVFQINRATRREMGMMATCLDAKKTAKSFKISQQRARKKQQKSEVNEKQLSMEDGQLFYMAKVKELRSFFECGVWEFSTAPEADPNRTLTSRILLKRSKNADGIPRARERGYNDVDASAGAFETSSPVGFPPLNLLLAVLSKSREGASSRAEKAIKLHPCRL